jgi:hypothetical protein
LPSDPAWQIHFGDRLFTSSFDKLRMREVKAALAPLD